MVCVIKTTEHIRVLKEFHRVKTTSYKIIDFIRLQPSNLFDGKKGKKNPSFLRDFHYLKSTTSTPGYFALLKTNKSSVTAMFGENF